MKVEEIVEDNRVASPPGELAEELTPEEQALRAAIENGGEIEEPPEPGEPGEESEELEAGEEEPDEGDEGQRVPLAELLKEREKGRAYKQQLDELQAKVERGEKRLEELFAKQKPSQPEAEADPEPDREEDWIAWSEWKIRQQDKMIQQLNQGHQTQQQISEEIRVRQQINAMEADFRAAHEDYQPRLVELGGFFDELLTSAFPDAQRRQGFINMLTQAIVNEQLSNGRNPAEIIYQMGTALSAMHPAAPAAAPETPRPRPTKAATRAAKRTLSNVGSGEPAPSTPSYDDIINMTDEQYEAFRTKMGDDGADAVRRDILAGNG